MPARDRASHPSNVANADLRTQVGDDRTERALGDVSGALPGVDAADVVGVDHHDIGRARWSTIEPKGSYS